MCNVSKETRVILQNMLQSKDSAEEREKFYEELRDYAMMIQVQGNS